MIKFKGHLFAHGNVWEDMHLNLLDSSYRPGKPHTLYHACPRWDDARCKCPENETPAFREIFEEMKRIHITWQNGYAGLTFDEYVRKLGLAE